MTDLDAYQVSAMRFHVPAPVRLASYALGIAGEAHEVRLASYALGIAGEAGEVADLMKKHIGYGHPLDVEKLELELGDVLWYVAALAHIHGISLSDVANANLAKLEKRYPNGFNTADSIARKDVTECRRCNSSGFLRTGGAGEYKNCPDCL